MKRLLVFAILIFGCASRAYSVIPPTPTQMPAFHHTSWDIGEFGAVYDIQQDRAGFLWLQTANGIYRFDGAKFLSVDQVTHGAVRNSAGLDAVLPSRNGGVWFLHHGAGLIFWDNDQVQTFTDSRCAGRFSESPDGSLWIAGSSGLLRLKGKACEAIGKKWGMTTDVPAGLLVDREGTVWVKTWTGDLLFLKPGATAFQVSPYGGGSTTTLSTLGEAPDGSIWLTDGHGLREVRAAGNASVPARPPGIDHARKDLFGAFAFERDGSIWIATETGARWAPHPEQWATPSEMKASPGQSLTIEQGISSNVVWSILVDREDSAWMATNSGLDQMRRSAFHAISLPHVQEHQLGIAPGTDGSIWAGSESLPLTHVWDGKTTTYPVVASITSLKQDHKGTIWVASKDPNHLWRSSGQSFKTIPYPYEKYQSIVALAVDGHNDLWISLRQYGVFRLSGATWTDENDGLAKPKNVYGGMTDDEFGSIWFAFGRKLVEWNGTHFAAFSLPEKAAGIFGSALMAAHHHAWFPTKLGIELFDGRQFHLLRFSDAALPGIISGLAETPSGDLWLNGFSGVTHVSHEEMTRWFLNTEVAVSAEHLDRLDGLPGLAGEAIPKPSLVTSREGLLWFATTKGVAWLDPKAYERGRNRIPPPVVISSVTSDGLLRTNINNIELPAHTRRLELGYDALSFAIPQRVLFKYRLDGLDTEWQNAGTRRTAFYNSLAPGKYRFRVIACNNDGVWSEVGASIAIRVDAAYYQTWWFRALALLASLGIARLIWIRRFRMVTRELQGRLTARLEERERIARELHDTLLQGIFGLTLRLQASVDQLEDGHPVRADITRALNHSDAIMLKGRERIKDLRDLHHGDAGLVATLDAHGRQLQAVSAAQFRISVEGQPRELNQPIEEEVLLIGCEALTNAFRHASASLIQVEIVYRNNLLQITFLDDGTGMDPAIMVAGQRENHWGIPSMRERATNMRARFSIDPRKSGGTAVRLRVPGVIVYRAGFTRWRRFRSIFQRNRLF